MSEIKINAKYKDLSLIHIFSDVLQKIFGNLFPAKQAFKKKGFLSFLMHLAHDTHTVILDQIGNGNFPGHFQKRKIVSFTPVDNFLGNLLQIHSRIDDNSGAFCIFHGGNQAKQPAFIAGFHSGGDGEFFSAEPVDVYKRQVSAWAGREVGGYPLFCPHTGADAHHSFHGGETDYGGGDSGSL